MLVYRSGNILVNIYVNITTHMKVLELRCIRRVTRSNQMFNVWIFLLDVYVCRIFLLLVLSLITNLSMWSQCIEVVAVGIPLWSYPYIYIPFSYITSNVVSWAVLSWSKFQPREHVGWVSWPPLSQENIHNENEFSFPVIY